MTETDLTDPTVRLITLFAVGLAGLVYGVLAVDGDTVLSLPFVLGAGAVVPLCSRSVRRYLATLLARSQGNAKPGRDGLLAFLVVGIIAVVSEVAADTLPATVRTDVAAGVTGVLTAAFALFLVWLAGGVRHGRA